MRIASCISISEASDAGNSRYNSAAGSLPWVSILLNNLDHSAEVCLAPGIDAKVNRVNFVSECWCSWWIQLQSSEFSYSVNCSSTVLSVTPTKNSVLASEHLQSGETLAELVSQRDQIFLSNTWGLQKGKGLQGHLGLAVLCLPDCSPELWGSSAYDKAAAAANLSDPERWWWAPRWDEAVLSAGCHRQLSEDLGQCGGVCCAICFTFWDSVVLLKLLHGFDFWLWASLSVSVGISSLSCPCGKL